MQKVLDYQISTGAIEAERAQYDFYGKKWNFYSINKIGHIIYARYRECSSCVESLLIHIIHVRSFISINNHHNHHHLIYLIDG